MEFYRHIIVNNLYKRKNLCNNNSTLYVALFRISAAFMLFLSLRLPGDELIIVRDDGRGIRNLAVVVTNHLGLFVEGLGKTKRPHCRCHDKTNSFEFIAMAASICQLPPETVRNVYKYAYSNVTTFNNNNNNNYYYYYYYYYHHHHLLYAGYLYSYS